MIETIFKLEVKSTILVGSHTWIANPICDRNRKSLIETLSHNKYYCYVVGWYVKLRNFILSNLDLILSVCLGINRYTNRHKSSAWD